MAENARPPVAVRIVRPYDTEEDFLESELETVGKTSVILIGAHARPQGVILRFEVTLQNGTVILRGEGRVLQHKESAFRGQPGLALRFTRLDPKSKALVDRAAAIREARLSGSIPPQPVPAPSPESNPAMVAVAESSSSPISVPDPEPTPPPRSAAPPPIESRPPTKPPPASSGAPPIPNPALLAAIPSFPPMAPPSNIPSNLPSGAPVPPNATLAPDPMLAQLLIGGGTPPPPPITKSDRPTSRPPPENPLSTDEEKTRPGKVAHLIEDAPGSQGVNVHATTTVAAPPIKDKDDAVEAEAQAEPEPAPAPEPEPVVAAPSPPPPPAPRPPAPKKIEPPKPELEPSNTAVTRVADRDGLLARLRERRASMSDTDKEDILRKR